MWAKFSTPPTHTTAARPIPIETGQRPVRARTSRLSPDPRPQRTNAAAIKANADGKILNAILRGEKQRARSACGRALADEPANRLFEPLPQRNLRLPTKRLEARNIQQLARGPVRL
jgi:hypothetical protein